MRNQKVLSCIRKLKSHIFNKSNFKRSLKTPKDPPKPPYASKDPKTPKDLKDPKRPLKTFKILPRIPMTPKDPQGLPKSPKCTLGSPRTPRDVGRRQEGPKTSRDTLRCLQWLDVQCFLKSALLPARGQVTVYRYAYFYYI